MSLGIRERLVREREFGGDLRWKKRIANDGGLEEVLVIGRARCVLNEAVGPVRLRTVTMCQRSVEQ